MWWFQENKSFVFARQYMFWCILLGARLAVQNLLFLTNIAAA
jgi:hypothetical protein